VGDRPNFLYVNAAGTELAELSEGGDTRASQPTLIQKIGQAAGLWASTASDTISWQLDGTNPGGGYDAGGGMVVTVGGDTLQTVAQRVYGNASLWYVIADANNLEDPNAGLTEGVELRTPSVQVTSNDAATLKPYDANAAIGSTTPSLPYITPPPQTHCNPIANLMRAVVAVICLLNPGIGIPMMAALSATTEFMAETVENIGGQRNGYDPGAIAAAALTAGAGSGGGALGVIYAAANAVVGDLVHYGVDKLLGDKVSFSWKNIAVDAGAAALASAVLPSGSGPGQLTGSFSWTAAVDGALEGAGEGLVTEGIHYGLQKAITGSGQWSWTNVAMQAAEAGLAAGLTNPRPVTEASQAAPTVAQSSQGSIAGTSFGFNSYQSNGVLDFATSNGLVLFGGSNSGMAEGTSNVPSGGGSSSSIAGTAFDVNSYDWSGAQSFGTLNGLVMFGGSVSQADLVRMRLAQAQPLIKRGALPPDATDLASGRAFQDYLNAYSDVGDPSYAKQLEDIPVHGDLLKLLDPSDPRRIIGQWINGLSEWAQHRQQLLDYNRARAPEMAALSARNANLKANSPDTVYWDDLAFDHGQGKRIMSLQQTEHVLGQQDAAGLAVVRNTVLLMAGGEIPVVASAIGAYFTAQGVENAMDGHPVLGTLEAVGGLLGLGSAVRQIGMASDLTGLFGLTDVGAGTVGRTSGLVGIGSSWGDIVPEADAGIGAGAAGKVPNSVANNTSRSFKAGEDQVHFEKHGPEIARALGIENYSVSQYVDDANWVIQNGDFAPELNAYASIPGGTGSAKGLLVGLDRATGEITTMHLKPVSWFEAKAPSLGWEAQPWFVRTDTIGLNPQFGWRPPYKW
jgi:hypothetical protein